MVCTPWATVFIDPVNPHDGARMFETVVMCLAACAMVLRGGPWYPSSIAGRIALIGLLAFGSLSVLAAERVSYAALEASAAALLVIVVAVLARTDVDTLLRELPGVVAVSALMSVLMELPRLGFFLADARMPQAGDFGFMYMSHRFLNHAQSLILPMAVLPLLVPSARWVRVAAWIGLAGGLAVLWRTGGRGTLLALCVFAGALPYLLRSQAKQVLRVLTLVSLAAAFVYLVCFVLPPIVMDLPQEHRGSATDRLIAGRDSGRFYLWKLALDDALQNPWLGIGPMHYAHQPNLLAAHPHNSIAQLAAEWGLPMTLCMLVTLATLFVRGAMKVRATSGADARVLLVLGGLTALVGGVDSLVSGTLVMPVSQMWWVIALGCMLAGMGRAAPRAPVASFLVRALLVGALVALHLGLSVVTYHRSVRSLEGVAPVLERTNMPRYWINGFF